MDLLWLIIVGAIVGWLGRLVAGRDVSLLATILIGIVGTWLGFYVWGALGGASRAMGYVLGVVVAAILVSLVGGYSRRRSIDR